MAHTPACDALQPSPWPAQARAPSLTCHVHLPRTPQLCYSYSDTMRDDYAVMNYGFLPDLEDPPRLLQVRAPCTCMYAKADGALRWIGGLRNAVGRRVGCKQEMRSVWGPPKSCRPLALLRCACGLLPYNTPSPAHVPSCRLTTTRLTPPRTTRTCLRLPSMVGCCKAQEPSQPRAQATKHKRSHACRHPRNCMRDGRHGVHARVRRVAGCMSNAWRVPCKHVRTSSYTFVERQLRARSWSAAPHDICPYFTPDSERAC